jgi:hypothetical protein
VNRKETSLAGRTTCRWNAKFSGSVSACLAVALLLAVMVFGVNWATGAEGKAASVLASLAVKSDGELQRMLDCKDAELDLALANWLIALEIPEFRSLMRADYFKQVDSLTQQVRQHMGKMEKVAVACGESLTNAHTRCAIFCNAIIKLGFAYAEEFRQEKVTPELLQRLYADPNNICLAGLLRIKRSSSSSAVFLHFIKNNPGLPAGI